MLAAASASGDTPNQVKVKLIKKSYRLSIAGVVLGGIFLCAYFIYRVTMPH